MRRIMLCLMAVGLFGLVGGCHSMHSHGICDCEQDDYCSSRQPWALHGAPISGETIQTPPVKLPDVKKKDL